MVIVWIILGIVGIVTLYLLFSLILLPVLMVINNSLDSKENSTAVKKDTYTEGILTLKIEGNSSGEVMYTGGGLSRNNCTAKLYQEEDIKNNVILPTGTKVLIIEMVDGIAYVIKYKNFLEERYVE